jgi:hypothetical protein
MCADFGLQERVPEVSEDFTGGKDEVTKNQATTKERISLHILISFVCTTNRFQVWLLFGSIIQAFHQNLVTH